MKTCLLNQYRHLTMTKHACMICSENETYIFTILGGRHIGPQYEFY